MCEIKHERKESLVLKPTVTGQSIDPLAGETMKRCGKLDSIF